MTNVTKMAVEVKSEAWFKGVAAASEILFDEGATGQTVRRELGIFACADGLCEGICAHSYALMREKNELPSYDATYDFADGVQFVIKSNPTLSRSEDV